MTKEGGQNGKEHVGKWIWSIVVFLVGSIIAHELSQNWDIWFRADQIELPISTSVPYCVTGHVKKLISHSTSDTEFSDGADRTYICDNRTVFSTDDRLAADLANTYYKCLSHSYHLNPVLSLKEKSPAVCRANYRIEGSVLEPTSYEQGINICLAQYQGLTETSSQTWPRACSDTELRRVGFFPQ